MDQLVYVKLFMCYGAAFVFLFPFIGLQVYFLYF